MKLKHCLTLASKIALALLLVLISACQKDMEVVEIQDEKNEILDYLAAQEYNVDSIEISNTGVVYNGDAGWEKETLLAQMESDYEWNEPEYPEPINGEAGERQRGLTEANRLNAVSASNVTTIRYHIRATVWAHCGLQWVSAIQEAAARWNALSHSRIRFVQSWSSPGAQLIIGSDLDAAMPAVNQNLPIPTVALATFPSNGEIGEYISINALMAWHPRKKEAMMHEMGHCLGFDHTGSNFGQHIFGTPFNQSGSVMNGSLTSNSANLKSGDRRLARLFYPENLLQPISYSVARQSSGNVRITYANSNPVSKPYYWIRITKYTLEGQILAERFVRSATNSVTGLHTLTWPGHGPGAFRFAVRGMNFRRDVWSSRTGRLSVTL